MFRQTLRKAIASVSTAALLLSAVIVPGMGVQVTLAATVDDAASSTEYYGPHVGIARDGGVLSAGEDFDPAEQVTRAYFVKNLVEYALGTGAIDEIVVPSTGTFSDVPSSHSLYPHIETAAANNMIVGYSDGTFKPNQLINRAEAAKLLVIARYIIDNNGATAQEIADLTADMESMTTNNTNFTDIVGWMIGWVSELADSGVTTGRTATTFAPAGMLLMAEKYTFLNRATRASNQDGTVDNFTLNFLGAAAYDMVDENGMPVDMSDNGGSGNVTTDDVAVALASSNPAGATVPGNANNVQVVHAMITNGSSQSFTLRSVMVERFGLGEKEDIESVQILQENGVRIGNERTFNDDDEAQVSLGSDAITIPSNGSVKIAVAIDFENAAQINGNENSFGITAINGDSSVDGLPIQGNTFFGANVDVGTIDFEARTINDTSLDLGDRGVIVGRFELEVNNVEDALVRIIRLEEKGSRDEGDIVNWTIEVTGIAGPDVDAAIENATFEDDGEYLTIIFHQDFPLPVGENDDVEIKVRGDIVGGALETSQLFPDEDSDVLATGERYGQGMNVTLTGNATVVNIDSGQLNIFSEGESEEFDEEDTTVILARLGYVAGTDIDVDDFYFKIAGVESATGASADNLEAAFSDEITMRIYDANDVERESVSFTNNDALVNDDLFGVFKDFTLLMGEGKIIIEGEPNEAVIEDQDTFEFVFGAFPEEANDGTGNNPTNETAQTTEDFDGIDADDLTEDEPITDIRPGSIETGQERTSEDADIVANNVSTAAYTTVAGGDMQTVLEFELEIGSADVFPTSLVATIISGDDKDCANYTWWAMLAGDAEYTVLESGISADATNKVSFDDPEEVILEKETNIPSKVTCDVADSGLSALLQLAIQLNADLQAEKVSDGKQVAVTVNTVTGPAVTLAESGSLVVTIDGDNDTEGHLVLSDSDEWYTGLILELDANNEMIEIEELIFDQIGATPTTAAAATVTVNTDLVVTAIDEGSFGNNIAIVVTAGDDEIGGADANSEIEITRGANNVITARVDNEGTPANVTNLDVAEALGLTVSGNTGTNAIATTITNDVTGVVTATGGATNAAAVAQTSLAGGVGFGVPNDTAVKAQGTLTMDTQPTANDTMTIGAITYTYLADCSAFTETTTARCIVIGGSLAATQTNTVAEVNAASGQVVMGAFTANNAVVTAQRFGTVGNAIATTEAFTAGTNVFDAATLGTTTAGVNGTDTSRSVDAVSLWYGGVMVKQIFSQSNGRWAFTDLDTLSDDKDIDITRDGKPSLELKFKTNGIGEGSGDSTVAGDAFKFALSKGGVKAVGEDSENDLPRDSITVSNNLTGQFYAVYATLTDLALSSGQPTSLSTGEREILKLTATTKGNDGKTAEITDNVVVTLDLTDDFGNDLGVQTQGNIPAIGLYEGSVLIARYDSATVDRVNGRKVLVLTGDRSLSEVENYTFKANFVSVGSEDLATLSVVVNDTFGLDGFVFNTNDENTNANAKTQYNDKGEENSTTKLENRIFN